MSTNTILAPGRQEFVDANGAPLAGGMIFFYIPGGTTLKNTWQDSAQTILNTNPVILDELGSATIWGTGNYRMVLKSADGTVLWDQETASSVPDVQSVTSLTATGFVQSPSFKITGLANPAFSAGNSGDILVGDKLTPSGGIGPAVIDSVKITASPSIVVSPTGNPTGTGPSPNPPPTLASLSVQAAAGSGTDREFLVCLGMTSAVGGGITSTADKVVCYAGIIGSPGSANIWSHNSITEAAAGFDGDAQGYEMDLVNLSADRGNIPGGGGLAAPAFYGLNVSLLTNKVSAAIGIIAAGSKPFNRGLIFAGDAIAQSSIADYGNSPTIVEASGSHVNGLDWHSAAFSGSAAFFPNNAKVAWMNAAGSAGLQCLYLDTNDFLSLGNGVTRVVLDALTTPALDGALDFGASTARWNNIWAVNGTIQTSDPRDKLDLAPMDDTTALVKAISPVNYRMKVGGVEESEGEEVELVQATEDLAWEEEEVELKDGVAQLRKVKKTGKTLLWDEFPVLDASGAPVLVEQRHPPGPDGTPVPSTWVPRVHQVPRMVERTKKVLLRTPREGQRTHWGFDAEEIEGVFAKEGLDFAGHVQAEDGRRGLRADELLAVLWRSHKALLLRVEELERRLSDGH